MADKEIKILKINDVKRALAKLNKLRAQPHSRLLSWEHCIQQFAFVCSDLEKNNLTVKDINEDKIDFLSIHLGFYLASWGMMRGSTELLDKDYKIHIPAVKVILKHYHLFGKDLLNNTSETLLDELFSLEKELKESYVTGKEGGLKKVSDTLVTKIIMGTLGIVPAYDTQVKNSLSKYQISTQQFNKSSVTQICKYFSDETKKKIKTEIENYTKEMKKKCPYYTNMKTIDALLWLLGK